MAREMFVPRDFKQDSIDIISKANAICRDYHAQGYDLTLRQVYYQFVARAWLANSDKNYKRLGSIVNDARLAGLMDWDYIVDRTRYLRSPNAWETPSEIVDASASQYQEHLWRNQTNRAEVWVEKDALVGVVERACEDLRVPFLSCRGYVSQSEMYTAGTRLGRMIDEGLTPRIIHLGDHDPSGLDMTRDIQERLTMFAGNEVEVDRIALNMDQIEQYQPPPNPAKLTDSRGYAYVNQYGYESWELDALEPRVLSDLIQAAVTPLIDWEQWETDQTEEIEHRGHLATIAGRWDEVEQFITA